MIKDLEQPGTPITGERTNLEVARSAALGLWSCSKSRSNKIVSVCVCACCHRNDTREHKNERLE